MHNAFGTHYFPWQPTRISVRVWVRAVN